MRENIRKSNREIKKLKKYEKVTYWSTIMSLPVSFITPLSLLVALSGTTSLVINEFEKKKHRWVLLGR
jgi:hypothetical protein